MLKKLANKLKLLMNSIKKAEVNQIEALKQASKAMFVSGEGDLGALLIGIKVAKMSKYLKLPISLNVQIIENLREIVYGIHEKNRLAGHVHDQYFGQFYAAIAP